MSQPKYDIPVYDVVPTTAPPLGGENKRIGSCGTHGSLSPHLKRRLERYYGVSIILSYHSISVQPEIVIKVN